MRPGTEHRGSDDRPDPELLEQVAAPDRTMVRVSAQFAAAWKAGERRLAGLSSNSHLITAAGTDQIIWRERPELVPSSVADAFTP